MVSKLFILALCILLAYAGLWVLSLNFWIFPVILALAGLVGFGRNYYRFKKSEISTARFWDEAPNSIANLCFALSIVLLFALDQLGVSQSVQMLITFPFMGFALVWWFMAFLVFLRGRSNRNAPHDNGDLRRQNVTPASGFRDERHS